MRKRDKVKARQYGALGEGSSITVKEKGIYVDRRMKHRVGVICVMQDLFIELGMSVDNLITALQQTRLPVVISCVVSEKGNKPGLYSITRINTGKVGNVQLGVLLVKDGNIIGYEQKEIGKSNEKFVRGSALERMRVSSERLESALRLLLRLGLRTKTELKLESSVCRVRMKVKEYDALVEYVFLRTDDNNYVMNQVRLLV